MSWICIHATIVTKKGGKKTQALLQDWHIEYIVAMS